MLYACVLVLLEAPARHRKRKIIDSLAILSNHCEFLRFGEKWQYGNKFVACGQKSSGWRGEDIKMLHKFSRQPAKNDSLDPCFVCWQLTTPAENVKLDFLAVRILDNPVIDS
jgi:hypothetical protein